MTRSHEQVVLVTGGARGIGAAVCRSLSNAGALVFAADVQDDSEDHAGAADGIHPVHLDVTSEDDWRRAIDQVESAAGPISSLVNNAGIVAFESIEHQDPAAFRRVLDVNLYGAWLGIHTTAPSLRRAGGGSIINMSSTAGLMGYPNVGAYVCSKWGLRGLTKTAALELAPDGVRVCSVHPGPIRTRMTAGMDESIAAGQPIARFGEPEEVASMVLFLIAEASYSTGAEFIVDGGAAAGAGVRIPESS